MGPLCKLKNKLINQLQVIHFNAVTAVMTPLLRRESFVGIWMSSEIRLHQEVSPSGQILANIRTKQTDEGEVVHILLFPCRRHIHQSSLHCMLLSSSHLDTTYTVYRYS